MTTVTLIILTQNSNHSKSVSAILSLTTTMESDNFVFNKSLLVPIVAE